VELGPTLGLPSPIASFGGRFRGVALSGQWEENPRFETDLSSALRIAHGLGIEIELRLAAGPDGGLELRALGPPGARWFDRVLAASYPLGSWESLRRSPSTGGRRAVAVAEPIGKWDQPFRSAEDSPRWIDAWIQVLSAVPARHSIRGRFRPIAASLRVPVLPSVPEVERGTLEPGSRFAPLSETERRLRDRLDRRQRVPAWAATIDLESEGTGDIDSGDLEPLIGGLASAARLEGANGLRFRKVSLLWARSPRWFALSEDELRALLPSPATPALSRGSSSETIASCLWIGRTRSGISVTLPVEPAQGRHFALLGETGMGKSSLLVRIALGAARIGGLLLLDPIGDTGRELLSRLPAELSDRVRWVSPVDSPLGLNALEASSSEALKDPTTLDRRIGDLVTGLKRVRASRYVEQMFWGPRIEEMLFRSLRAAALYPNGSLEDALHLLESVDRAPRGVPESARAAVQELHQRVRDRPEELDGARRVLNEIVRSPMLRSLLCRRSSAWNAAQAVDPRAIVVVTGDAAQVGELTARYLLSVYLALLWSEILARPRPTKLFFLSDEVQWFGHESLTDLLRLGRRFNVHVGIATQAMRSLPEAVRESIWTNCSDFVVFRGSPDEAREFARWLPALVPAELLGLGRGNALVFLGKGSTVAWLRTDPLRSIRGRSLDHFKKNREQLPIAAPAPTGLGNPLPDSAPSLEVPAADAPPGVRRTFAIIAAWIEMRRDAPEVEIPLEALRRTTDSDEDSLRRAGSILGRLQALRTHRDEGGKSSWCIRPDLFRAAVDPPVSPEELRWGQRRAGIPDGDSSGPA
jgi:hypothetical protein